MTTKEFLTDVSTVDMTDEHITHLTEQIKAAVGDTAPFYGLKRDKFGLHLIMDEDAPQVAIARARSVANAYDPSTLPVKDIEAEKVRAKAGKFDDQINKIKDENVYDILLRMQAQIEELEKELKGKK